MDFKQEIIGRISEEVKDYFPDQSIDERIGLTLEELWQRELQPTLQEVGEALDENGINRGPLSVVGMVHKAVCGR